MNYEVTAYYRICYLILLGGIGWTYYRYPHVAASAWFGLALLHEPVEGGPAPGIGSYYRVKEA